MVKKTIKRKHIKSNNKKIQKTETKATTEDANSKNIVLYVGHLKNGETSIEQQIAAVKRLKKTTGTAYKYALLLDSKNIINQETEKKIDILIRANTSRLNKIEEAIAPYKDKVAAVVCKWDRAIPLYSRVIQLFPYLNHPSSRALHIAIDKIESRRTLKKYAPETVPPFAVVHDKKEKTIRQLVDKVGFPCVIKPASLFSSTLITVCYYKDEFKTSLKDTFRKIKGIYKNLKIEHEPKILVEKLMEGEIYSVDAFVSARGKIYFTPLIHVKTGRDIGRDDFSLYSQMTPTDLNSQEVEVAQETTKKAIYAFGLASCAVHVELYKTKDGWKIIELSPRIGGYREEILNFAYGMRHTENDILNHLGIAPKIKNYKKRYCVLLKFWPKETGNLKSVIGYKKISEAPFVAQSIQKKKPGDKIGPAKYGDPQTLMLYLVADSKTELLGHIRKVEKTIKIVTE